MLRCVHGLFLNGYMWVLVCAYLLVAVGLLVVAVSDVGFVDGDPSLPLLLPPPAPSGAKSQLLMLQYAASTTAGGSTDSNGTNSAPTHGKRQSRHSSLFSSSPSPSPSPSPCSPEGLFLVGSKFSGGASSVANRVDGSGGGGGGRGGVSSLLIVPPEGSPGNGSGRGSGRVDGGITAGWAGSGGHGAWRGGRRQGTLGEKVVARALECLEGLCGSEECERFMTPLAREV